MTNKKENILKIALEMFGELGYNAVSTSAIAKKAGVSEGLIFRHFTNKDGLLAAILEQGNEQATKHFASIVMENDAKTVIRKAIDLPLSITPAEQAYWRLLYSLKWQKGSYDGSKTEPLKMALENAFRKLGYNQPTQEAELLLLYFDGLAAYILLHDGANPAQVVHLLKQKYKV